MKPANLILACAALALPYCSVQAKWFEESNTVSKMHESLLNDDLNGMFDLMVQVWQQESEDYLRPHLDALLEQAVEKDCGKSLMTEGFPAWLDNVVINKNTIQRPGRTSYKVRINIESESTIKDVSLLRWPDSHISSEKQISQKVDIDTDNERQLHYTSKNYSLSSDLKSGLYQIIISDVNGESWKSWVILDSITPAQEVRWESRDSWAVDKKKLLNPSCPLPRQTVEVLEYSEGKYSRVWQKSYESRYPKQLPKNSVEPNRYLVSVSMINSRWQGPIIIQEQNTISKTIDLTEE